MKTVSAAPGDGRVTSGFISSDSEMERIKEIARRVADKDVPVLILGESGVGKEVVARYLHGHSERRDRPFLKINCAAVPSELLESELFGHEKGAFTGATASRAGQFELADDGTLLLDEIGEMEPQLQAKLLHVLQDKEFHRVGGKTTLEMEARVVATTNVDLEEAVADGGFREDLYFRLAVITLEVPPLRQRREEIPPLVDHFLAKYTAEYEADVDGLPDKLTDALREYDWPGNVRELENAIRRYVLLPDLEVVLSSFAKRNGHRQAGPSPLRALEERGVSLIDIGEEAAERAEKEVALKILEETNWNRKQAAERLNVCYKTLLNKLDKWQIRRGDAASEADKIVA